MPRLLMSALVAFAAVASILSLAYPIPLHSDSTYVTSSVLTAVNPEILVDYSTSTVTCGGSPQTCYEQIIGYTTTTTWSGETTQVQTLTLTSMTLVPIAFSSFWGSASAVLFLLLLLISGALLAKDMIFRRTAGMNSSSLSLQKHCHHREVSAEEPKHSSFTCHGGPIDL